MIAATPAKALQEVFWRSILVSEVRPNEPGAMLKYIMRNNSEIAEQIKHLKSDDVQQIPEWMENYES